jgi:hypothetical protein
MPKYRTLMRIGICTILILFLLLVIILVWPTRQPSPEAIAKRGLSAPDTGFSMTEPTTWRTSYGSPRDWIDQGMDSVMHWDKNPWKTEKIAFFHHLNKLRDSSNPNDQAEYQRLKKLGKEWYERILARYPELAVSPREVPDDQNGLLRWMKFVQAHKTGPHGYDFGIPPDFDGQVKGKLPWNPEAAKAWLDANRPLTDELRAIGLMTNRSTQGIDPEEMPAILAYNLTAAMLLDARLAAERGDPANCLEIIRAANGLGNHFQESDAAFVMHDMVGSYLRNRIQDYVFTGIMPSLPAGQVNLADWEQVLNPTIREPAALANTMKAEWNGFLPTYLLASLADTTNPQLPSDPEALAEAYTRHTLAMVQQHEKLALSELPSTPIPELDTSDLSWRSREIAKDLGSNNLHWRYWERSQIHTGMTQAAFAILKGQPVPNDPIYGKPYTWNPETRELSLPAGDGFKRVNIKPIILPKL